MVNELIQLVRNYAKQEVAKVLLITCSCIALLNVLLAIFFTLFFTKETVFIFLVYLCCLALLNLIIIIGIVIFWYCSRRYVKDSLINCISKIVDVLFFEKRDLK